MRRGAFVALLAAGLLAAVVTAGASGAPSAAPGPVTLDGIGGVVPGMTPEQVAAAWGIGLRSLASACDLVPLHPGAAHGRAIFVQGRLSAVFFDRGVRTSSGIGIGSTSARLEQAFGANLQSETGSHYYFLTRHDRPHWQIRFDTNRANRVVQIAFGEIGSVHVLAGCA